VMRFVSNNLYSVMSKPNCRILSYVLDRMGKNTWPASGYLVGEGPPDRYFEETMIVILNYSGECSALEILS